MTQYWLGHDGEVYGPYTETDLRVWLESGEVEPDALVWHEGLSEWSPLLQVLPTARAIPATPPLPPSTAPAAPTGSTLSESRPSESAVLPEREAVSDRPAPAPFGLRQGMTVAELGENVTEIAPGKYRIVNPPKPHSAFEYYVAKVGPSSGLGWIKGIGKTINTNVYGEQLRLAFAQMKSKLEATYGVGRVVDRLEAGSIWDEPKDFMTGLRKSERKLYSAWSASTGAVLPRGLESVFLSAVALDDDEGCLTVEYEFTNSVQCDSELSAEEDGAL